MFGVLPSFPGKGVSLVCPHFFSFFGKKKENTLLYLKKTKDQVEFKLCHSSVYSQPDKKRRRPSTVQKLDRLFLLSQKKSRVRVKHVVEGMVRKKTGTLRT
jgi:hypothetical protein